MYHCPAKTIITKIQSWAITEITIYKDNLKTKSWTFFIVVIKVMDINLNYFID